MNFLNPRSFFLLGLILGLLGTWAVSRPLGARSDASAQGHAEARLTVSPRPPAVRTLGGSGVAPLSALDRRREFLAALAAAAGDPARTLRLFETHVPIWLFDSRLGGYLGVTASRLFAQGGLAALQPFLERGQRARGSVLHTMCASEAMTSFSENDVREIVDLGFPAAGIAQAFNKLPPHEDLGALLTDLPVGETQRKAIAKEFLLNAGIHAPGEAARLTQFASFVTHRYGPALLRSVLAESWQGSVPEFAAIALNVLGPDGPSDSLTLQLSRTSTEDPDPLDTDRPNTDDSDPRDRLLAELQSPMLRGSLQAELAGEQLAKNPALDLSPFSDIQGSRQWEALGETFLQSLPDVGPDPAAHFQAATSIASELARSAAVDATVNFLRQEDPARLMEALGTMDPWLARKSVIALAKYERAWEADVEVPISQQLGAVSTELKALFDRHSTRR